MVWATVPLAIVLSAFASTPSAQSTATSSAPIGLDALVDLALEANRQVAIDGVRVNEARAMLQLATAEAYPKFALTAIFGGPTPEARTRHVNEPASVTPASLEGDFEFGQLGVTFRASAQVVQPVYTFGKLSKAESAAKNLVEAATHKTDITRAEVILNVHRAFWGYQLVRGFVESLSEGEGILESILAKVEELLENDSPQVTEADRLRLVHGLATLRVRLVDARSALALSQSALKLLVNLPESASLPLQSVDVDEIPETLPSLTDALEGLRAARPETKALDALVRTHTEWADYQRLRLMPNFFLGGFVDFAATSNATNHTNPFVYDRFNYFDTGIGLGVSVELDVFTKLAELSLAEAQLETRKAEQSAADQAMELEVRKAHADVSSGYARIEHLSKAHRAAKSWLTAEVLAYDVGTGSARDLIDAFIARATAEGELEKTYFDLRVGLADLARVSGHLIPPSSDGAHAKKSSRDSSYSHPP